MAHGVRCGDIVGLLLVRRQIIQLAVGLGGIEVEGEGELPVVDPDGGLGRVQLVLCGTSKGTVSANDRKRCIASM